MEKEKREITQDETAELEALELEREKVETLKRIEQLLDSGQLREHGEFMARFTLGLERELRKQGEALTRIVTVLDAFYMGDRMTRICEGLERLALIAELAHGDHADVGPRS